jgi:hypothetical protein
VLTRLTVLTQKRVLCGEHSVQRKARFIAPLPLLAVPRSMRLPQRLEDLREPLVEPIGWVIDVAQHAISLRIPSPSSPCRMCWPACRFAGMEERQAAEMT